MHVKDENHKQLVHNAYATFNRTQRNTDIDGKNGSFSRGGMTSKVFRDQSTGPNLFSSQGFTILSQPAQ